MPITNPVVVEFIGIDPEGNNKKEYFIGASLEDVLRDTNGGESFGWSKYASYRPLSPEEAEKLNLKFYVKARNSILNGGHP